MPPSRKRSYTASQLGNGAPTTSKRTRTTEAVILSSDDSSSDIEVLDDDPWETRARAGARAPTDNGPASRPTTLSVIEQLRLDEFCDFKAELCLELDSIRAPPAEIETEIDDSDREAASAVSVGQNEQDGQDGEHVREVLRQWIDQDKASRHTNHLYYRFDCTYREGEFDFVGRDAWVLKILADSTEYVPFEVFLALLEREDDNSHPSYFVRCIVDLDGEVALSDIPVEDQNWVQTRLPSLKAISPMVEVAVLMIPRDSVVDFLLQHIHGPVDLADEDCVRTEDVEVLVRYFTARISVEKNRGRSLPLFRELCARAWALGQAKGLAGLGDLIVEGLLQAILDAQDWEFFEEVASRLGGSPPPSFFTWVSQRVKSGTLEVKSIEKGLLATVLAGPTASLRCIAARNLLGVLAFEDGGEPLLRRLITAVSEDMDVKVSSFVDGQNLVHLVFMGLGPEGLTSRLLPIVKKNAAHTSFGFGVLNGLQMLRLVHPSSRLPNGMYEQVAGAVVDGLDVSKLFYLPSYGANDQGSGRSGPSSSTSSSSGGVNPAQLNTFVSDLLEEGLHGSVLSRFALKLVADAGLIKPREFLSLWLPFLKGLVSILEKHRLPLSTPRYRHLIAAILEAYLARCVGAPPKKWPPTRRSVLCGCRICALVNRFLTSSVSAASFTSISEFEVTHINTVLSCYVPSIACNFTVEDGRVVIRKLETEDGPKMGIWTENNIKATVELGKVDSPSISIILGRDYPGIFEFENTLLSRRNQPVPIESLDDSSEEQRFFSAPASGLPAAPPPMSRRIYARGYTPRNNRIGAQGRGPPSPPATSQVARPGTTAGFDLFASEYGRHLRRLPYFRTPESIQIAVENRWKAMIDKERERYDTRAFGNRYGPTTPASSASVPFNPHRSQPLSTPQTPTQRKQPVASNGSSSLGSGHVKSRSTWRGPRPFAPTPTQQAVVAAPASSPSFNVLRQVSSSRLNAAPQPSGYPKIKTEAQPRGPQRGAQRKTAEVIDLTEDD